MLLQKGKFVNVTSSLTNLPYEIEYEQIKQKLKENTYNKYNIPLDKRKNNNNNRIIMPRNENSYMESNMFVPYPQDTIPYQESGSWIGGYDNE